MTSDNPLAGVPITVISELREHLNQALWQIIHLENGWGLCEPMLGCSPITDPDQRKVLLKAKAEVQAALDLEPDYQWVGEKVKAGRRQE